MEPSEGFLLIWLSKMGSPEFKNVGQPLSFFVKNKVFRRFPCFWQSDLQNTHWWLHFEDTKQVQIWDFSTIKDYIFREFRWGDPIFDSQIRTTPLVTAFSGPETNLKQWSLTRILEVDRTTPQGRVDEFKIKPLLQDLQWASHIDSNRILQSRQR